MSINTTDMVPEDSRNCQANKAGHLLYGSIPEPNIRVPNRDSPTNVHLYSTSSTYYENNPRKISAVRRTFCLLVLFDLILTFILWVIYTQMIGETPMWSAFVEQVEKFSFKYSLFDTVMLAVIRFTLLLLAYALFRINHWWVISLTTFLTCVFLISKCFIFKFIEHGKTENPLSYALLIIAFVLAWIETWFLDFKVLPQEKKDRQRQRHADNAEARHLLSDHDHTSLANDDVSYYTPEGSDDENGGGAGSRSANLTQEHSRQEYDYTKVAQDAWDYLWELMLEKDDRWKFETGHDIIRGCIHSRHVKEYGRKLFRLQGVIDMSPECLFREMVDGLNNSPEWNPTLLECRTLEIVDDCTEISYSVAAEAAGGLVSSRDFINVRRWGQREGVYLSAGSGVNYPKFSTHKKHVRGENGPGGWVFNAVTGNPQQCFFMWFINTDLKGWIPKAAIDQALAGVLLEYLEHLRMHIEEVKLKIDYS